MSRAVDPDPDAWQKALSVLRGDDSQGISMRHAADAAGVSTADLRSWIRRSREHRDKDDPWVWDICKAYDEIKGDQAATLEDIAWNRATNGTPEAIVVAGKVVGTKQKHDNGLLMRLLEAKNPKEYGKEANKLNINFDASALFKKFQAAVRIEDAKAEHGGSVIDSKDYEELEDL